MNRSLINEVTSEVDQVHRPVIDWVFGLCGSDPDVVDMAEALAETFVRSYRGELVVDDFRKVALFHSAFVDRLGELLGEAAAL